MKVKELENLKFSDLFDGLYLGACLTGGEIIIALLAFVVIYFVLGTDRFENILVAMLFLTNIVLVTYLKHKKAFEASVWKEIIEPKKEKGALNG